MWWAGHNTSSFRVQGSESTHFFLLSFLTLASLSKLSPAASCIRSSSCFFSLHEWCASGERCCV